MTYAPTVQADALEAALDEFCEVDAAFCPPTSPHFEAIRAIHQAMIAETRAVIANLRDARLVENASESEMQLFMTDTYETIGELLETADRMRLVMERIPSTRRAGS